MQTIIVFLIVALAFYFVGRRLYGSFREDSQAGCGCGCGGCSVKSGCGKSVQQVGQPSERSNERRA
jgi:hypothetical protein